MRSSKCPEALRFVCLMPGYAACAKSMREDKDDEIFHRSSTADCNASADAAMVEYDE
jgi:hypothetical protein